MGGLLFVSQAMLDTWAGQGRIELVGNAMTLLAADGNARSYALEPAVRFLKVVGTDRDPNGLVQKVKSVTQLREMGAEPFDASCILGDVAYEVEPGFLAEGAALQAAARTRPSADAPPPTAPAPVRSHSAPHHPPRAAPAPSWSAGPSGRSSPRVNTPLPRELEEKRKEAEALARFLLENLS